MGSYRSISIWTQQTFLHWDTGLRTGQADASNIRERLQGTDTTKRTAQGRVWSLIKQPTMISCLGTEAEQPSQSPFEVHRFYTDNTQHNSSQFSVFDFSSTVTQMELRRSIN